MLKKRKISIDKVMKSVATKNGFKYIPPNQREKKEIVIKEDELGNSIVHLTAPTAIVPRNAHPVIKARKFSGQNFINVKIDSLVKIQSEDILSHYTETKKGKKLPKTKKHV